MTAACFITLIACGYLEPGHFAPAENIKGWRVRADYVWGAALQIGKGSTCSMVAIGPHLRLSKGSPNEIVAKVIKAMPYCPGQHAIPQ